MIQIKLFRNEQSEKLQQEVNKWLCDLTISRDNLISINHSVADSQNSRVYTILITYEVR